MPRTPMPGRKVYRERVADPVTRGGAPRDDQTEQHQRHARVPDPTNDLAHDLGAEDVAERMAGTPPVVEGSRTTSGRPPSGAMNSNCSAAPSSRRATASLSRPWQSKGNTSPDLRTWSTNIVRIWGFTARARHDQGAEDTAEDSIVLATRIAYTAAAPRPLRRSRWATRRGSCAR